MPTFRFELFSSFVCLAVNRNDMRGTLPDLGNTPRLEALFLHQNQISGTLSVSESMKWLDVTSNRWYTMLYILPDVQHAIPYLTIQIHLLCCSGCLSSEASYWCAITLSSCNYFIVVQLLCSRGRLSGTMPFLGSGIISLMANNVKVSGTIPSPDRIGSPPSLQILSVMRAYLRGSLANLANYTQLNTIMLAGNYLSCQTPSLCL